MLDLKPTFSKYYPEGSIQGQCAYFAEKLVAFGPVGNFVATKTAYITRYGTLAKDIKGDFRAGDAIMFSVGQAGHAAVINCVIGNQLRLTESNWELDEKVHHNRLVAANHPQIIGIVRAPLRVKIIPMQIPIPVKIVANNLDWSTLYLKLQAVKNWYAINSHDQISLEFDVEHTVLGPIPFQNYDSATPTARGVVDSWYDRNVTPLAAGYSIVAFCMTRSQWESSPIYGGWRTDGAQGPIELQIGTDENETSYDGVTTFNCFEHYLEHEISHALYMMTGQPDRTHEFDYTSKNLALIFTDLNYQLIQSYMTRRIVYKKAGEPTLYLSVGDVLFGFACSWSDFQMNCPDAVVSEQTPDWFITKTIAPNLLLKHR